MIAARSGRLAIGLSAALAGCSPAPTPPSIADAAVSIPVYFEPAGPLEVLPRAEQTIRIRRASGQAEAVLRLSGDYRDASLDKDSVVVGPDGASFTLRTPSSRARFLVTAEVAGLTAELSVATEFSGSTGILALARYRGDRPRLPVVVHAMVDGACADFGTLGPPVSSATNQGLLEERLALSPLPLGANVSVFAQMGNYATACVDTRADAVTPTIPVGLDLVDTPLDIMGSTLLLELAFSETEPLGTALPTILSEGATSLLAAFSPGLHEGTWILDAVERDLPTESDKDVYRTLRATGQWDDFANEWMTMRPSFRATVTEWMRRGRVRGPLRVTVRGQRFAGYASVEPSSFGPASASRAGVTAPALFGWSASGSDVVQLTGGLLVNPSALAGALGEKSGEASYQVVGMRRALSAHLDAPSFAQQLVGAGVLYEGCAEACALSHVESALDALWSTAIDASSSTYFTVNVTASGRAIPGEKALIDTWDCPWVGSAATWDKSRAYEIGGTLTSRGIR